MRKETTRAIAYAQQMLSFLFLQHTVIPSIQRIFLFGSAARGELTEESDIDIFIDCSVRQEKAVESAAEKKERLSPLGKGTFWQKGRSFSRHGNLEEVPRGENRLASPSRSCGAQDRIDTILQ